MNQTIGDYQLIQTLGKGAFGEVILAADPKTIEKVAIKVFRYSENRVESENVMA